MSFRQAIPRPPDVEVVEPAARFAGLRAPHTRELVRLETVERALSAPTSSDEADPHDGAVAAVLLALLPGEGGGELSIALIRRAVHLRANPGEIAFPGGRIEPGEGPARAALREAEEEVALPPSAVRLLGSLPSASRASRPGLISPFVGVVNGPVELTANPDEVDEVLLTPLLVLVEPGRYWEEIWWRASGEPRRMAFFGLGDDLVWGASARILVTFLDLLAGAL